MLRLTICLALAGAAMPAADRKQELADLRKIFPPSSEARQMAGRISAQDKSWEDWLTRTGGRAMVLPIPAP